MISQPKLVIWQFLTCGSTTNDYQFEVKLDPYVPVSHWGTKVLKTYMDFPERNGSFYRTNQDIRTKIGEARSWLDAELVVVGSRPTPKNLSNSNLGYDIMIFDPRIHYFSPNLI